MADRVASEGVEDGIASPDVRGVTGGRSALARAAIIGVALSAVVALLLVAFIWPAVRTAPRNIPLAVAGPPAAVQQISAALAKAQPGAFEVIPVGDEAAARTAILDRDVLGALVIGQKGVTVLTAPGASTAVASLITEVGRAIGTQLQTAQGVTVPNVATTEVVVPAGSGDPLGAGFPSLVLPLVIASLLTGIAASFAVKGTAARLVTLLVSSVLAGLWASLIAGNWFGVLPGSWAVVGVAALSVLSVSAAIVGAHTLVGRVGVAIVAPVVLLLGNPLSAAGSAPQLLPDGWAALGQALPPGATVQALRSAAFFDGARVGWPIAVLSIWAAAGLLLVLVGHFWAPSARKGSA
jgi:hypothetical protein